MCVIRLQVRAVKNADSRNDRPFSPHSSTDSASFCRLPTTTTSTLLSDSCWPADDCISYHGGKYTFLSWLGIDASSLSFCGLCAASRSPAGSRQRRGVLHRLARYRGLPGLRCQLNKPCQSVHRYQERVSIGLSPKSQSSSCCSDNPTIAIYETINEGGGTLLTHDWHHTVLMCLLSLSWRAGSAHPVCLLLTIADHLVLQYPPFSWTQTIARTIKQYAPNALVMDGSDGVEYASHSFIASQCS